MEIDFDGFEWNEAKAIANFEKHGVIFSEAIDSWDDDYQFNVSDESHSTDEPRYKIVGATRQGRLLAVIYTYRDNKIRIISARRATTTERRKYEDE